MVGAIRCHSARAAGACALALLAAALGGCVPERTFPMRAADLRVIPASHVEKRSPNTRIWLQRAQTSLGKLLHDPRQRTMLTEDLSIRAGVPADVMAHFGINPRRLRSIFSNPLGLLHSAQALKDDTAEDAWADFADVQIPVDTGVSISARLGVAASGGRPAKADCIVVVSGLLGDNSLIRTRDLCRALQKSGFHTLAVELRGYGKTLSRAPQISSTFGISESTDLIAVADWLEARPFVRDTGLIGFCWGANEALLAAWENGRAWDDADVAPRLRSLLRRSSPAKRYRAGVIAFSPVLRFEEIVAELDQRASLLSDPVLAKMGDGIRRLMIKRGYAKPSRSLRTLFESDAKRSELYYPGFIEDGLRYLRFLPYQGKPASNKLEAVRVPLLIVHAASDPLGSAQDVADLFCQLSNERVAALILPGGGHNGFAVYNRSYFYSLILNFFDPDRGAAAQTRSRAVASDAAVLGL